MTGKVTTPVRGTRDFVKNLIRASQLLREMKNIHVKQAAFLALFDKELPARTAAEYTAQIHECVILSKYLMGIARKAEGELKTLGIIGDENAT